ncbi:YbhB/YbcL family Raf kinase inhibitor-like protein [bacterium]|nr:YbhB/YbcL family Raf kinase inhibitor-like protein [bacterium]
MTLLKSAALCAIVGGALVGPALAQQYPPAGEGPRGPRFEVSSPVLVDGEDMPEELKCTRHDGTGMSPPLDWANARPDVGGYAIVMQHYPRGTYPGVNEPSHYWLVWNIPADATGVAEGNPDSLGVEGSNKDIRDTGYTPPCSEAGGGTHEYTIWVYALDGPLDDLPTADSIDIGWTDVMSALDGHILDADSISFID